MEQDLSVCTWLMWGFLSLLHLVHFPCSTEAEGLAALDKISLILVFGFPFPGVFLFLELVVFTAWLLLLDANAESVNKNLVKFAI